MGVWLFEPEGSGFVCDNETVWLVNNSGIVFWFEENKKVEFFPCYPCNYNHTH